MGDARSLEVPPQPANVGIIELQGDVDAVDGRVVDVVDLYAEVVSVSVSVAKAIRLLEERAALDPELAEAVVFLADDADGPDDPFGDPGAGVVAAAQAVNERRLRQRREGMDGLDTADVVQLIGSISDRKGVDRRRRRGQLLGWRMGTRTVHPTWQFDRRLGDTRPGLTPLLAALAEVTSDPQTADALMTAPREDLEGRTLADVFAAGRLETVVRLIRMAGDQS